MLALGIPGLSTASRGLERQEQDWQATDKVLVLVPMVVAQQRVSHGQESPLEAGDLDEGPSV